MATDRAQRAEIPPRVEIHNPGPSIVDGVKTGLLIIGGLSFSVALWEHIWDGHTLDNPTLLKVAGFASLAFTTHVASNFAIFPLLYAISNVPENTKTTVAKGAVTALLIGSNLHLASYIYPDLAPIALKIWTLYLPLIAWFSAFEIDMSALINSRPTITVTLTTAGSTTITTTAQQREVRN